MFNKLKQVNEIRKQAKIIQDQLSDVMVVGESRGKNVMITIDGNQQVQGVKIEESLEREEIAEHVKQAFNDGSKKLQKELALKMRGMGGLDALKDMLG